MSNLKRRLEQLERQPPVKRETPRPEPLDDAERAALILAMFEKLNTHPETVTPDEWRRIIRVKELLEVARQRQHGGGT